MSVTRLNWDVLASNSDRLTDLQWITGKVRKGDAFTILDYLARRFDAEVEGIRKDHSWGYAARNVRGASVASEHSAGVAVDFNAPTHPLGKSGTFSNAQVTKIHKILADLDGAVRWGGDYSGRKDEMHFELQGGAAKLARVAKTIKAQEGSGSIKPKPSTGGGTKPSGVTPPKKPYVTVKKGSKGAAVGKVQRALRAKGYAKQIVDNDFGAQTGANIRDWQRRKKLVVDGVAGDITQKSLGL